MPSYAEISQLSNEEFILSFLSPWFSDFPNYIERDKTRADLFVDLARRLQVQRGADSLYLDDEQINLEQAAFTVAEASHCLLHALCVPAGNWTDTFYLYLLALRTYRLQPDCTFSFPPALWHQIDALIAHRDGVPLHPADQAVLTPALMDTFGQSVRATYYALLVPEAPAFILDWIFDPQQSFVLDSFDKGSSPMGLASYANRPDALRVLGRHLNAEEDVDAQIHWASALQIAVERDFDDVVAVILEECPSLAEETLFDAMHQAIRDNKTNSFQQLLLHPIIASDRYRSAHKDRFLHAAARYDRADMLDMMQIRIDNRHVNHTNVDEQTPLQIAAQMGHAQALVALLAFDGIDIEARTCKNESALEAAIRGQQRECALLILARLDIQHRHPGQPLCTLSEDCLAVAKADPDMNAILSRHIVTLFTITKTVLLPPINVAAPPRITISFFPSTSQQPIAFYDRALRAMDQKTPKALEALLAESEENINQQRNGWTLLHHACHQLKVDMVKVLLQQPGISVNLKNKELHTPRHQAMISGTFNTTDNRHKVIIKMLSEFKSESRKRPARFLTEASAAKRQRAREQDLGAVASSSSGPTAS